MKFQFHLSLALLAALLTAFLVPSEARTQERIVGGTKTPVDTYKWIVALANTGSPSLFYRQFCGASLIAPDWVLTAAHCVEGETAGRLQVVVGLTDLEDTSSAEIRGVKGIFRHPGFRDLGGDLVNDMALLLLDSPVNSITPVAYARSATAAPVGSMVRALGWGDTRSNPRYPTELHQVDLKLVPMATARRSYRSRVLNARHLAAMASGKDTCSGDSGGPIFDLDGQSGNPLLVGVTSYGIDCAVPEIPGIYANVGNYGSWLDAFLAQPLAGDPDLSVYGIGRHIANGTTSVTRSNGTNFGRPVRARRTVRKRFVLTNPGGAPLAIDRIHTTNRKFRVAAAPSYVFSGGSALVTISFRHPGSSRRGLAKGRLIIRSNDPDAPTYSFSLLARYVKVKRSSASPWRRSAKGWQGRIRPSHRRLGDDPVPARTARSSPRGAAPGGAEAMNAMR